MCVQSCLVSLESASSTKIPSSFFSPCKVWCIDLSIGGPGSGKGSICSLILSDPEFQHLFCHISIGDVLREEIARGGENGPVIQQCMKDGKLLPWDMILRYLQQGIDAEINKTGRKWVLLDGFPRMLAQGRKFEQIAVNLRIQSPLPRA